MEAGYDARFFELHRSGSVRSASIVVPLVLDLVSPRSVVDVGCGSGSWLSVFTQAGIEDVLGIDGAYVDRSQLDIPADRFLAADLSQPLRVERQFDLVLCLEVAEHLEPECAGTLLDTVTSLGPVVLFSAAVPFQGGTGHRNEQWPDHWAARFAERGYRVFDPIRPRIWTEAEVEFWYAQNILLYVRGAFLEVRPELREKLASPPSPLLPIVHPRLLADVARRHQEDHAKALHYIDESQQLMEEVRRLREVAKFYIAEAERLQQELDRCGAAADRVAAGPGASNTPNARALVPGPRSSANMKRVPPNPDSVYLIHEVDLLQPLPEIRLRDRDAGVALVVRQGGRPVGFVMEAVESPRVLAAAHVARMVRSAMPSEPKVGARVPPASAHDVPVTVAICTRNNPEDVAMCLDQVMRLAAPAGGVEVLVVDNAPSDDRTKEVVRSFAGVRYIHERHAGLNFARNRALREARGEIIAFVDDDARIDHGWLAALRRTAASYPEAAAFTGLVLPAELETGAQVLFEARGGFQKYFETVVFGQSFPGLPFYPCIGGKFGTGCNMAFHRSVALEIGGFDVALDAGAPLPGGGDTDMLYRVIRAGYSLVYEPEVLVFHRHRRDYPSLERQYSRSWSQGLMAFVAKSYRTDPAQRRNLLGLAGAWFWWEIRDLLRSLRGHHPLPPGMLLGELWGAVVGLTVAYPRSVRRVRAIRRTASESLSPPQTPSAA